jgi:hypothetical protein
LTFQTPDNIITHDPCERRQGGRLQIGIPGRLRIGMHGRLRRNPQECVVSSRLYYKNMISGYTLETLPGDKKAITAARWSIIDVLEELQGLLGISLVPASVE